MKKVSTIFLRVAVAIIGLAVLAVCIFALPIGIRESGTEGYGPILIGMYITAIPFFYALYQAWKLLTYIDTNSAFSDKSVQALRHITYSAFAVAGLYVIGMPYIYLVAEKDDAPGVIALGLMIIFVSVIIAVFSAILQKLLKNAIQIQSENELTV